MHVESVRDDSTASVSSNVRSPCIRTSRGVSIHFNSHVVGGLRKNVCTSGDVLCARHASVHERGVTNTNAGDGNALQISTSRVSGCTSKQNFIE